MQNRQRNKQTMKNLNLRDETADEHNEAQEDDEEDYQDEDEEVVSDSLFQKVMRKINNGQDDGSS